MRIIQFLLLTIVTVSCIDGKPTKTGIGEKTYTLSETNLSSERPESKTDSVKKVDIGYAEKYEKLPKLTFETISEGEFLSLHPTEPMQTFKPVQNGNFFYIQTALKKHKFKKYKDYDGTESWSGFEFLGYYSTSKLFAIRENSTSESLGFGQLFLLDSLNDYEYNIISFGDGAVELPIPSTNDRYFVYFYNSVYEHKNSDIGVLKINDKSNPKSYLKEYASYKSVDFAIEKIVWKTDNIFFVKGYEEIYENEKWIKKYKYYKTEFE